MLALLFALATNAVGVDAACACPVDETTAVKVERLKAELDAALTQLRLEKAAEKVNRAIERRKAKR